MPVADEDRIPDLKEALRRGVDGMERPYVDPSDIPSPPGDWTTHPVARSIFILILLVGIVVAIWKWPEMTAWVSGHPFGAGLIGFIALMLIAVISISYWKTRAFGDLGYRYWDTDRKRKPK